MSKISLAPDASGTGIFTIASPNSNTNRTLTLPDDTGTIVTNSGNQAGSFTTLNTSGAVVFNDAGADVDFRVEGDTEANLLFVDASADKVGIGTSSPARALTVFSSSSGNNVRLYNVGFTSLEIMSDRVTPTQNIGGISFLDSTVATASQIVGQVDGVLAFVNGGLERARIASDGSLILNSTNNSSSATDGKWYYLPGGEMYVSRNGGIVSYFNRNTDDGTIIEFRQANTEEGTINVSGTTVSYNGGHLSRWAQLTTPKDDTPLFKGTVMSNLDEMNVYIAPTTYWTEEDELPDGVNVGDVKVETHEVENEQLNKVKVSDVEGDANVAGVFVNWTYDEAHQIDEINMAMTGDMIIRIAEGVTVARGDLLMSAGDGTAKPQGDDIVRSKTIAKVTSTHVTCTYEDGSYCVPCVLMAC
jgi:hypothetical protein